MKLMVIDDEGNAYDCVLNIEEYNLLKPLARASVMDSVISTLEIIWRKPRGYYAEWIEELEQAEHERRLMMEEADHLFEGKGE